MPSVPSLPEVRRVEAWGCMPRPAVTDDPYAAAKASAERLAQLTGQPEHDAAVILGSGWAAGR